MRSSSSMGAFVIRRGQRSLAKGNLRREDRRFSSDAARRGPPIAERSQAFRNSRISFEPSELRVGNRFERPSIRFARANGTEYCHAMAETARLIRGPARITAA